MSAELTTIAAKRFDNIVTQIHRWWEDRFAIGLLLREVRDDELYKHKYASFDQFAEQEFGFKKAYTYRLIEAANVKGSLKESTIVDSLRNPGQAHALAAVPEEDREAVLETAAETGKVTARSITEAAQKVAAPKPEKTIHLDKTGWPIPDSVYPDWQSAEALKSLLGNLQSVKLDVEHALENKELAFREVTNTTLANLKNAWMDLQRVLPYAVCPTCQGHNRDNCTLCKKRGFISKFGYDNWVPADLKAIREKGK